MRADGGTLYRVTEENTLRFEIVRTTSLKYYLGGTTGNPVPFYPVPLYKDGQPNHANISAYAALTGRTVNIADAYVEQGFDFSGTRNFDKKTGYRSKAFLTVPMKNHDNEIIGVLQLINPSDPRTGEIVAFSPADQRLAESLASQAAVALTNRMLINQLEELFESFIGMINTAIDEKSPYTGGPLPARADADDAARRGGRRDEAGAARGLHDDRPRQVRAQARRPAARLRQGHHAGPRGRQGHEARDDHRPDPRDRDALRGSQARRRDRDAEGTARQQRANAMPPGSASSTTTALSLRNANIGVERMSDEDVARVERIGAYRWKDVSGRTPRS
jgi:hypothetical protein